ncbi:phage portal protein [Paludibacterium yongneupense]|uniref:phage portal protein n=1 Tax=Paludibacterium yongneupense TaxID=400061 RepID=UPI00042A0E94|nr:phage portal protein [Paludibacterium yongneupense]
MDFNTLQATFPADPDYPERTAQLAALTRVLDGTLYNMLGHPFAEEHDNAGEYIPLAKRRPSVRTRICQTVVNDSVSLLFSGGHFPAVECKDEPTRDALAKLVKETGLNEVMIDAATRGSVGSVAVLMKVLKNRVFWQVLPSQYRTPTWDPDAPDTLLKLSEQYKVKGGVLKAQGYTIADGDIDADFWFLREWDAKAENWFLPLKVSEAKDGASFVQDDDRTVPHGLGFVPVVWIRNLPGGDDIDGVSTFPVEAIDTQIEADYLLSQGGRALKYQSDPTLHIKEPAHGAGAMVKGAANVIVTSVEGDAKLLEISGDSAHAVMDWVKALREIALEGAGANRANADKLSSVQSGRAMELMNQALIWLADKLRISYGEGALLELLNMAVRASTTFKLVDKKGRPLGELSQDDDLALRWPQWYLPTYTDKQTQAETLTTLRDGGLLSRETSIKSLAASYDIADPTDEIRQIESDPPLSSSTAAASK